jgi:2-polyprenyl-3-methyl-5-hydroxy-6-metoxy-1,4-benzoquinol methylase/glycosyltransferase involved in cell wall biosynthesis
MSATQATSQHPIPSPMNGSAKQVLKASRYEVDIDVNSDTAHAAVLRLVGTGKRVLELGCASGYMSRILRERNCSVVGVELDPLAAEKAETCCDRVVNGDLDHIDFSSELESERFDVVVAADVLEHLKDPVSVLRNLRCVLQPEGYLVMSVPNVAHLSVRLALLSGDFQYGETGLLDRTHLRFFTRQSIETLLDDAGFTMGHLQRIHCMPSDPAAFEVRYDPAALPAEIVEALSRDPDASTYQFVLVAYPLSESGMSFVQARMREMTSQLSAANIETIELRRELDGARKELAAQAGEFALIRDDVTRELQEQEARLVQEAARLQRHNVELEGAISRLNEQDSTLRHDFALLQQSFQSATEQLASLRHELSAKDAELSQATARSDELLRQNAGLRLDIDQQQQLIPRLRANVDVLNTREKDLREMLLEAHDQLCRRDEEIAAALAASPRARMHDAGSAGAATSASPYLQYSKLQQQIRDLVSQSLPQGANVLVISKGDGELLRLGSVRGFHFPQREDGVYAGYHPANSEMAVTHLNQLREKGADFLLIPQTSLWWLAHYRGFAQELEKHRRVVDQPDTCIVYDLSNSRSSDSPMSCAVGTPSKDSLPFGVNVIGHLTSEKGVGEGARSTLRSLRSTGIPTNLNNLCDESSANVDTEFTQFTEENPFAVNLVHLNADELPSLIQQRGPGYLKGRYNIGYWAWELSAFPDVWTESFSHFNELWVPSTFVMNSVSRVSPIPVITIPHSLPDRLPLSKTYGRGDLALPANTFLFLFLFDFMSIVQRKNPVGLIKAFKQAFKPRDKVTLLIKTSHAEAYPREMQALECAARGHNIRLINTILTKPETNSLLNACDCYVSLHRSEGFGLTLAEAMSLGKPVIGTAYSGNMDFMTPGNSFPVAYQMAALEETYGPYLKGSVWAEPSIDHAAELMRAVYTRRDLANQIGRQARSDVRRILGINSVGSMIEKRFKRLHTLGRITFPEAMLEGTSTVPGKPDKQRQSIWYGHLVARIRQIVSDTVPVRAQVAVVSKGDENLVTFESRKGVHFPQELSGAYTGYHPANSWEAIGRLEMILKGNSEYLLFPQTALWWLDEYPDFRAHLDEHYRRIWSDPDCIIYSLATSQNQSARRKHPRKRQVRGKSVAKE